MKITLTLTIFNTGESFDIQVQQEQKIRDTLFILQENRIVLLQEIGKIEYVRLKSNKRKIDVCQTYEDAGIFSGAHIVI